MGVSQPLICILVLLFGRGHFDIVKCLVVDGECKPITEHLDTAIRSGHFGIVKWLVVDGGCKPITEHLDTAIQRGTLAL